jgi:hypothetical protein
MLTRVVFDQPPVKILIEEIEKIEKIESSNSGITSKSCIIQWLPCYSVQSLGSFSHRKESQHVWKGRVRLN